MSPAPILLTKAQRREMNLRTAEALAQEADLLEARSQAVIRCKDTELAERGQALSYSAKKLREAARRHLVIVTNLTDYRDALDIAAESGSSWWHELERAASEAARCSLTPGQVSNMVANKSAMGFHPRYLRVA